MKYLFILAVTAILSGCAAGTDFKRMEVSNITLGQTKSVDIVQKMGTPFSTGPMTQNGESFERVTYTYAASNGTPAIEGVTPARAQSFVFHKDVLVGTDFTSSWMQDTTNFEQAKVKLIQKNKTSISELIKIIGKPGGEYIYPLIENENEKAKVYVYSQVKAFGLQFEQKFKSLIVSYDPKTNIVTDVKFIESNTE